MIQFFCDNWGNILVLALVAAAVVGVLFNSYRERKAGKSSCGCGCSDCPSKGICHPNK